MARRSGAQSAATKTEEENAMPVIRVDWIEGRTKQQKAELAAAITECVVRIGKASAEKVHVVFVDFSKSDWAQGGKLLSDQQG